MRDFTTGGKPFGALDGLVRIREFVPGGLNATFEAVPLLAVRGLVRIEPALHQGTLVSDVIDPSAIVNLGIGAYFVGLGHQPIELRAQLPESCFYLSYALSYCLHGTLPFAVAAIGPMRSATGLFVSEVLVCHTATTMIAS